MKNPSFCRESVLPHSPTEVFAWHTRTGAFERFNPPWRPVRVIQPPESLRDGSPVHIKIPVLGPLGISWRLIHREYRENEQFCDEQVRGPFRSWKHYHRFIANNERSCCMRDEIHFALPYGIGLAKPLVIRELNRLFRYRHMILQNDLDLHARFKDAPRKTILVSGSSGFIGSALCAFLSTAGHTVRRLVRHPARHPEERSWDPDRHVLDPSVFEGVDVVIHLGGESLVGHRWTPEYKRRILESRTKSSALLCKTIAQLERRPEVVIMASAIGYYGDTGETVADERSPAGSGFLAETCKAWEASARDNIHESTRLVHIRIGTVLNAAGGALKQMLPVFKLGAGGVLGTGRQYMSWIALQDLLGIFEHAIYTSSMRGAFNAVAPEPVTNREFTKTIGKIVRRPTIAPAPAVILRLMFGEVADAVLLASCRVAPRALVDSGYTHTLPNLEEALRCECGEF